VCTWNIQFGRRLPGVLAAVAERDEFVGVDLLALQEASVHHGVTDSEAIAQAMGTNYGFFQATAQVRRGREQANGLVWNLEAFAPCHRPQVVALPDAAAARLRPLERSVLRTVRPQTRMALCAESGDLRVYVLHLDVVGFAHKLAQFRAVLEDMSSRPAVPVTLIAGDLNTFGPSRPRIWRRLAALAHSAGLTNVTAGVRRTHWTGQKLDAIYAQAARPLAYRAWTLKVWASDHLPVFADIKMEVG
jgi:endonuclease/exonuclease/phosphatase family metal-dependent hydrolase